MTFVSAQRLAKLEPMNLPSAASGARSRLQADHGQVSGGAVGVLDQLDLAPDRHTSIDREKNSLGLGRSVRVETSSMEV